MTKEPPLANTAIADKMSVPQNDEIGAITTGGPFGHPAHSKYEKLISLRLRPIARELHCSDLWYPAHSSCIRFK